MNPIPFIRLDRQFEAMRAEIEAAMSPVLESGWVLQSPQITELEQSLASLLERRNAVAVNSGTDALILALSALGLPEGSPVAVPAITFIASASAIVHNRHEPVFVDVDPRTLLMDVQSLLELIRSDSIQAVLAVHLYGQMMDLGAVRGEAEAHGIPIIEDAAQALGCTREGRPPGDVGAATCLSFDPTKVIGAMGSAGAFLTDSDDLAETVRELRYHGHVGDGVYQRIGHNSQMHALQAAILNAKLKHAGAWQAARADIARRYEQGLAGVGDVRMVETLDGNVHNHHKFVIQTSQRDGLAEHLTERDIQTKIHYRPPLHLQPCFAPAEGKPTPLPQAEAVAGQILSLPMYAELTDSEVDRIIQGITTFFDGG